LINNRQGGRRRGRGGGGRAPNMNPNAGNRQDNRQRGNAAQLLEKYKGMARDAQMQGDRVQSEYFLQFADHYYRILNENRARFEEQRRTRDDYSPDEDEDQDEAMAADGDDGDEAEDRDGRGRQDRGDRGDRQERGDRPDYRDRPRREFRDRDERNGERRPERSRPRREEQDQPRAEAVEPDERISLDVLPPAISVVEGDAPAKAPRRRTRRPSGEEGDSEIAPAA